MSKKSLTLMISMLMIMGLPAAFAATTSSIGVGIGVTPGNNVPEIWMDTTTRELQDMFGAPLTRMNNYAFTGERISWDVLVRDANGVGDISSVVGTVGSIEGTGNPQEVACTQALQPADGTTFPWAPGVSFVGTTDRLYDCILTVEPGFLGEFWAQVVITDDAGDSDSFVEDSYFFFNPSIGLEILNAPSGLIFTEPGQAAGTIRPGNTGYSQTIQLASDVEAGSGVILDVDIQGTDFYDPANSAALCPTTNALALSNFRYYATKGSYTTAGSATADAEGYDTIDYTWDNIIRDAGANARRVAEGAEFAITFKLDLPSPCSGDFSSGVIEFQGEAI